MNSEAWIKFPPEKQSLLNNVVKKTPGKTLRGFQMKCDIVEEPYNTYELCRDFEKGQCKRLSKECHYKHILCTQPNQCEDEECHYGHTDSRKTISKRQSGKGK